MITNSRLSVFGVAAAMLALSGCSTTSSGKWQEPRTTNAPFKNILLIAAVPWDGSRLEAEQRMSALLAKDGTRAHKSIYLEKDMPSRPRTAANLQEMVNKVNADAVLVLRPIDTKVKPDKTQSKAFINIDGEIGYVYGFYGDAFVYEVSVQQTEALPAADVITDVTVSLYDVADQGRLAYVMSVENKYKDEGDNSTYDIATAIAKEVAKDLKRAGLVN